MVDYLLVALILSVVISALLIGMQLDNIANAQRSILKYLDNATVHNPYKGDSAFRVHMRENNLDD